MFHSSMPPKAGSSTVTMALQLELLPELSVIVKVTVLSPRSLLSKSYWLSVIELIPQLSVEPLLISFAVIIGDRIGDSALSDNVVYHRYGVPVMNQNTFYNLLDGENPSAVSERGGITIEIDPSKLEKSDVEKIANRMR